MPRPRQATADHDHEIARLHSEGFGSTKIGCQVGISRTAVANAVARMGLPAHPIGAPKNNKNASKK
jgi:hypothetical protein